MACLFLFFSKFDTIFLFIGCFFFFSGVPTTNLQVPAPLQSLNPDQDKKDKMMAFHSELSETCVDILSTYAYANLSAKPKRIPTAEFLLKNGQSCSWIIGTKIVTITTSTCDQTSNRGSLCDRCYLVCLHFYYLVIYTFYNDGPKNL